LGRLHTKRQRETEEGNIATYLGTLPGAEVPETHQQRAYQYVKSRIRNLQLKPGQLITDAKIAEELEVSRTPVREALRRLEQEGLLEKKARAGWRVYTLSLDDVKEIFDIKLALECMVARRAAECEDQALRATLTDALEAMKVAAEADDRRAWYEADVELHRAIFHMGGNERANQIIRGLNDQYHRVGVGFLMIQGRVQRSTVEHVAFVGSILAKDAGEAERRMCAHIENLRDELVSTLVNVVLPFADRGL